MKRSLQQLAARAARGLLALSKLAAGWRPDTLMATGAASVAYGAWQVYVPAGYIVAGGFLLTAGVLAARKAG